MCIISEKTNRMEKRAIRMQRKRQEDEIKDEIEKRKFMAKEEQLTAKFVKDPNNSS